MNQNKIDKIVDIILQKVALRIENVYNIEQSEILTLIKDIPDSLRCTYILRTGEVCNMILCQSTSHRKVQIQEDEQLVTAIDESIMYANLNEIRKKHGISPIFPIEN